MKVGDRVTWTRGGFTYHGEIVTVIDKGFSKMWHGYLTVRSEKSYIVSARRKDGKMDKFWPVVKHLKLQEA